jgi:hypothetical protein
MFAPAPLPLRLREVYSSSAELNLILRPTSEGGTLLIVEVKRGKWQALDNVQLGQHARELSRNRFVELGIEVRDVAKRRNESDFEIVSRRGQVYSVKVRSVRNFNYVFF